MFLPWYIMLMHSSLYVSMLTLSYYLSSFTDFFNFSFIPSVIVPLIWNENFLHFDYRQWDVCGHHCHLWAKTAQPSLLVSAGPATKLLLRSQVHLDNIPYIKVTSHPTCNATIQFTSEVLHCSNTD